MPLSTSDRIALAGVMVAGLGVVAAWLAVPMFSNASAHVQKETSPSKMGSTIDVQPKQKAQASPIGAARVASPDPHEEVKKPADVKLGNYTISFVRCVSAARRVSCDATIVDDRTPNGYVEMKCYPQSDTIVVDGAGITHHAESCAVGGSSEPNTPQEWTAPGVKYRLFAAFNGVDSTDPMRLLQFELDGGAEDRLLARFRDVPLQVR